MGLGDWKVGGFGGGEKVEKVDKVGLFESGEDWV